MDHKKISLQAQFTIIFFFLIAGMILCFVLVNSVFLDDFYRDSRVTALKKCYESLTRAVEEGTISSDAFDVELLQISNKDNIGIMIVDADSMTLKSYATDADTMYRRMWERTLGTTPDISELEESQSLLPFWNRLKGNGKEEESTGEPEESTGEEEESGSEEGSSQDSQHKIYDFYIVEELESSASYSLQIILDRRTSTQYLEMFGFLEDGSMFLLRSALEGIRNSSRIANAFFLRMGLAMALLGAMIAMFLAGNVTKPIREITDISNRMKGLDFSRKYQGISRSEEVTELGRNINELSDILEETISELKTANNELQKDLERKEEIEAMRQDFLSSVTHELKTPLALIQGYAEGLQDGMAEDPESRDFYCEVIVDEAGKMNNMVKKLLTLNQLEFGNSQVNMDHFDVVELVNNYIASARLLAQQQGIRLSVQKSGPIKVWADEFLVEEVFQNYYSNALHHVEGDKVIDIRFEQKEKCVRISVFNTGKPIPAEALPHLWEKFYKVDKARTREYGGSGVGLSIVRAIMNLLHQQYGVVNYNDGVMFWFELDTGISKPEIEEGDFLDQSGEDDIMDGEYIQL